MTDGATLFSTCVIGRARSGIGGRRLLVRGGGLLLMESRQTPELTRSPKSFARKASIVALGTAYGWKVSLALFLRSPTWWSGRVFPGTTPSLSLQQAGASGLWANFRLAWEFSAHPLDRDHRHNGTATVTHLGSRTCWSGRSRRAMGANVRPLPPLNLMIEGPDRRGAGLCPDWFWGELRQLTRSRGLTGVAPQIRPLDHLHPEPPGKTPGKLGNSARSKRGL